MSTTASHEETLRDVESQADKSELIDPTLDLDSTEDTYQVVLEPHEDPKNLSKRMKWFIVIAVSTGATCVTCASSMAGFTEPSIMRVFHVSKVVSTLGISLFVTGLGIGPLLVGPLSEVLGRNIIYQVSFFTFFAFSWPVAFAPDLAVYLIFRFVTGFCGSAFLSVAAASISDVFVNTEVLTPMSVYSLGPFAGPILGPVISGFINQHTSWRWTYHVLIVWSFVQLLILIFFVPETYEPILLKRKAEHKRKSSGNDKYFAPIERKNTSIFQATINSCYIPFKLLLFDRMALLLNTWNALILGILYLAFQAFPVIFEEVRGFNMQSTGLSFLGIGVGMLIAVALTPWRNKMAARSMAKYNGRPPPEVALIPGQIGAVLLPISLFSLAFTTYRKVHWIVPIIASVPFGTGTILAFTSTFTYLVLAYRPIAASAMASNSFLRSSFAAGFPLFAPAMYHRLGTVGATALLAGLTTVMAPLPFIFYRIGARLRQKSEFAAK